MILLRLKYRSHGSMFEERTLVYLLESYEGKNEKYLRQNLY